MLQLESLIDKFPKGWHNNFLVLDCFSESSGQGEFIFNDFYDSAPSWIRKVPSSKNPEQFHRFFGRIEREFVTPGTRLIFNSLSIMEHNWGRDAVKTFFGHVCPALYAYQTLAYWTLAKNAHPQEFCAIIEHMTQVVIELSKKGNKRILEVKKAGGRYNSKTYKPEEYSAKDLEITLKSHTHHKNR
jgi:hypothetical protein